MNLYNYDAITQQKVFTLSEGFYLSYTTDKKVVLTIKTISGLINSLIKGCPIDLVLSKNERLISIYIIDNKINPTYFRGCGFSDLDESFLKFETVIIDLIKSTEYKLVILNEINYQIANVDIKKTNLINQFKDWLNSNNSDFEIRLSNTSFSSENRIMYIDSFQNKIWNNELINKKPYFNLNEYLENGTHGYHQEFSIRNILSEFYQPNIELFPSVLKSNGEELTDFLILYKKAVVIIESKYTISPKQTKFNDAITKAIVQLNKTEAIIVENPELIDNEYIKKEILEFQVILKICVFYDDGRDLKKAFNNVYKNYEVSILPVFISLSVLKQIMTYLKILNGSIYKYNIIENFLRTRIEFRKKNKMIVIDGFDILTGAITFTY